MQYLRKLGEDKLNSSEDILISYDFQSGSYIKRFSDNFEHKSKYCKSLAKTIEKLGGCNSILEVGVGEATTFATLLSHLKSKPENILGFDISWSRIKFAKELLADFQISGAKLFVANLFEIPLKDNSIDIVYTSHSVEPNGGREKEALKELFRISKNYLVLLEPAYDLASDEAKMRMKRLGYVTELYSTAKSLGYKIIEHRLFEHSVNPLNPTGLLIIEKKAIHTSDCKLVCPITKTDLVKQSDSVHYSKDSYLAYPIIFDIPCLLKENAILATHLLSDYRSYLEKNSIVLPKMNN